MMPLFYTHVQKGWGLCCIVCRVLPVMTFLPTDAMGDLSNLEFLVCLAAPIVFLLLVYFKLLLIQLLGFLQLPFITQKGQVTKINNMVCRLDSFEHRPAREIMITLLISAGGERDLFLCPSFSVFGKCNDCVGKQGTLL